MLACTDEFLVTVTEGVVHSVYNVVTWLSFGVTQQHKVSGDQWTFDHCVARLHTNPDGTCRTGACCPMPINCELHCPVVCIIHQILEGCGILEGSSAFK